MARIDKIKQIQPSVSTAGDKDQIQKVLALNQALQQEQQQLNNKIAAIEQRLAAGTAVKDRPQDSALFQSLQKEQQQLNEKITALAEQVAKSGEQQRQIATQQITPLTSQFAGLQKQLQQELAVQTELANKVASLSKQVIESQQPQTQRPGFKAAKRAEQA